MLVREATIGDADAFLAVLETGAEEGWVATEPGFDSEERRRGFEAIVTGPGPDAIFVLEDEGEVVGIAGLHSTHPEGVMTLGITVMPAGRGRGGGRMLLERLIDAARAGGAHKLVLDVWPDNERAISLYETAGFEREGLLRDHYRRQDGTLRSAVLMAMPLSGSGGDA